MPRFHPTSVHRRLSDLLSLRHLKRPPPSYAALVNHPPQPLPLRRTVQRPDYDLPAHLRSAPSSRPSSSISSPDEEGPSPLDPPKRSPRRLPKKPRLPRPQPIAYPALDSLRAAFFRDHPFEAYRPISPIETEEGLLDKVKGEKLRQVRDDGTVGEEKVLEDLSRWTQLVQKTRKPSVEDCIAFAYSLHTHHPSRYPLSAAYRIAVSQFRSLRFEHSISSSFARQEAEAYGAVWPRSRAERGAELEDGWLKRGRKGVQGGVVGVGGGAGQLMGGSSGYGMLQGVTESTEGQAFTAGQAVLEGKEA